MSILLSTIKFEFKQVANKTNFLIVVLLIIAGLYFINSGIRSLQNMEERIKYFQETEAEKIKVYSNYTLYGTRGVRVMLIPSKYQLLFDQSYTFKNLFCSFDVGEKLDFFTLEKGKGFLSEKNNYADISGIILFLSFLVGIYGIKNSAPILKLVLPRFSPIKIYISIFLARVLVILVVASFSTFLWYSFLYLCGFNFFELGGLILLLRTFLNLVLFLAIGFASGFIQNKKKKYTAFILSYFVFAIFAPVILQNMKPDTLPDNFQVEKNQLKMMMGLEKRAQKEIGQWKSDGIAPRKVIKIVSNALENEHRKIRNQNGALSNKAESEIKKYHFISSLSPQSGFLQYIEGLTGRGHRGYLEFFRHTFMMKYQFVEFFVQKKFREKFNGACENFIQGNQNLFRSTPQLPYYSSVSIAATILFTFIFALGGYFHFRKSIYQLEVEKENIKNIHMGFPSIGVVFVDGPKPFLQATARAFMKPIPGATWFVQAPDIDFSEKPAIILPSPDNLPSDVLVKDFVKLFEKSMGVKVEGLTTYYSVKFGAISRLEKQVILLSIANEIAAGAYVLHDFLSYMECAHNEKIESPLFSNVWDLIQSLSDKALIVLLREKSYWKQSRKIHFVASLKKNKVIGGKDTYELLGGDYMTLFQPGEEFLKIEGYKT